MHEEMVKEIGSGLGLLTVREVAEYCAVDPDTVRENWIKTGIEIEFTHGLPYPSCSRKNASVRSFASAAHARSPCGSPRRLNACPAG